MRIAHRSLGEGAVAQSVEQRTENPCVAGSIPAHTTLKQENPRWTWVFLFSAQNRAQYSFFLSSIYRAFFFGSAFFCAELFFLVGLFFLGSAVFFDIDLNLRLVNYLLMAVEYFFLLLHVVLSEAATVQPDCK